MQDTTFTLKNTPAGIRQILASGPSLPRHAKLLPPGTPGSYFVNIQPKVSFGKTTSRTKWDVYSFSGKEVTVTQDTGGPYTKFTSPKNSKGKVIRPAQRGVVYIVLYWYYDNFDPNFAGDTG